jgi:hypothetical protein
LIEGAAEWIQKIEARGILLGKPIEDIDQLREPLGLFRLPFRHAVRDASLDVKPQNRQADAIQRRFGRRELLQDIYAETGFLHHSADATNLAFNPIEACNEVLLLRLI